MLSSILLNEAINIAIKNAENSIRDCGTLVNSKALSPSATEYFTDLLTNYREAIKELNSVRKVLE